MRAAVSSGSRCGWRGNWCVLSFSLQPRSSLQDQGGSFDTIVAASRLQAMVAIVVTSTTYLPSFLLSTESVPVRARRCKPARMGGRAACGGGCFQHGIHEGMAGTPSLRTECY